jgi:uncharacterized protein (DUF1697 family)
MTICIALPRAINLPNHKNVAMATLRTLLSELGFSDPKTLLQSGNLVFACDRRTSAELERSLEREAKRRIGLDTDFFVRTSKEWKALIEDNPFPDEAHRDPAHLVLLLTKDALDAAAVSALQAAIKGREVVRGKGRAAYIVYPDGIGRSKLTMALIEKKLDTRGTGRNWNTVLKLAALARTTTA